MKYSMLFNIMYNRVKKTQFEKCVGNGNSR